jgi:AcrR family transcriptional regulator
MRGNGPAGPSQRARGRDPEGTREAILAAAAAMMAEHGPQGVTVSDVARRAGVNRGTAYQHFPSRYELVGAVLERLGRTTKAVLDSSPPPSLNARIDETVKHFVGHPELVRLSLFRLLASVPHPDTRLWRDYVSRVEQLARRPGSRRGIDAEMLAIILLGATMLWSLRVQGGASPTRDTPRYLRELKRLMLYGIVVPESHAELVAAATAIKPPRARATRVRAPRSGARTRTARNTPRNAGARAGRGGP